MGRGHEELNETEKNREIRTQYNPGFRVVSGFVVVELLVGSCRVELLVGLEL